jgi:hypothetical protein
MITVIAVGACVLVLVAIAVMLVEAYRWGKTRKGGVQPLECQGVWEVVHTTKGDLNMGPPISARIDGEMNKYEFMIPLTLDAEMLGATLHRGELTVDVGLSGPLCVKDGFFTVIQDESMLDYVGKGSYLKPYVLRQP